MKIQLVLVCVMLVVLTGVLSAQDFQPAGEEWITKWWAMDLVTATPGHAAAAEIDYLSEGSNGQITQESVSTTQGLPALERFGAFDLPDNGGELGWDIFTIDPNNAHNASQDGIDNVERYAIIVITSPTQRTTTMHPTHDDYGHIWLNGEKVYDNPTWTGAATTVTMPTDVDLNKGENVLLFRSGESGGHHYLNLHFEATDEDLEIVPTMDDQFWRYVKALAIDPAGKISIVWGDLKRY